MFKLSLVLSSLLLSLGVKASIGTAHYRDYFYVAEAYFPQGNSSIVAGQIFVEHLVPAAGVKHKYPLFFIHGAGMTGTNFYNTPDERPGWSDWWERPMLTNETNADPNHG